MKHLFTFVLLLSSILTVNSQTNNTKFSDGLLKEIEYSKPFFAELHSTINKIEIGYHRDYGPYNLADNFSYFNRPMVEIHLGFDAPLYSIKFGELTNKQAKWGLGLSLPVSIHVLEDMWEPITAAVVDVDYRFGSPRIRGIRYFDSNKYIKNISFSWLPIFHECTHLGDELVLAMADKDYPLKRVNVSYEYTELQITLNDADGSNETNHSFRVGGRYRISHRGYGWFGTESFAVDSTIVSFEQSTHRFEYNIEYQLQRSHGFLASKRIMNFFSLDISSRVKLGIPVFHKVDNAWVAKDKVEKSVLTINTYFGWKFFAKNKTTHPIGLYFHLYRGINYWGQLRNQGNYGFFGIALTYEP
ncbi:MAG: hypothetical protein DRI86_10865 [Bacteroidetes bacterium]|nr:MAG: hypothetical protein DRI86_10865 [Bacteroidota bacterium]